MHFKMSTAICFNLDQSKKLSSGKGLILTILEEVVFADSADTDQATQNMKFDL